MKTLKLFGFGIAALLVLSLAFAGGILVDKLPVFSGKGNTDLSEAGYKEMTISEFTCTNKICTFDILLDSKTRRDFTIPAERMQCSAVSYSDSELLEMRDARIQSYLEGIITSKTKTPVVKETKGENTSYSFTTGAGVIEEVAP